MYISSSKFPIRVKVDAVKNEDIVIFMHFLSHEFPACPALFVIGALEGFLVILLACMYVFGMVA